MAPNWLLGWTGFYAVSFVALSVCLTPLTDTTLEICPEV